MIINLKETDSIAAVTQVPTEEISEENGKNEETGTENFYAKIESFYNFLQKFKKIGMIVFHKKENEINDMFKKITFPFCWFSTVRQVSHSRHRTP